LNVDMISGDRTPDSPATRSKALIRFDTRRQIDAGGVGLLAGFVAQGADRAMDRMLLPPIPSGCTCRFPGNRPR